MRANIDYGFQCVDRESIALFGTEDEIRQRLGQVIAYAKKSSSSPRLLKITTGSRVQLAVGKDFCSAGGTTNTRFRVCRI